jgi:hypothetical protein
MTAVTVEPTVVTTACGTFKGEILSVQVLCCLWVHACRANGEVVCDLVNAALTTDHQGLVVVVVARAATIDAACGILGLRW